MVVAKLNASFLNMKAFEFQFVHNSFTNTSDEFQNYVCKYFKRTLIERASKIQNRRRTGKLIQRTLFRLLSQ